MEFQGQRTLGCVGWPGHASLSMSAQWYALNWKIKCKPNSLLAVWFECDLLSTVRYVAIRIQATSVIRYNRCYVNYVL